MDGTRDGRPLRAMSRMGVRNIDGFNKRMRDALAKGEDLVALSKLALMTKPANQSTKNKQFQRKFYPILWLWLMKWLI